MISGFLRRQCAWVGASLYRKYVLTISLLVVGALLFSGGLDIFFTYKDKLSSLSDLERSEAFLAASSIDYFIGDVQRQLQQAAQVKYEDSESGIAAREDDYLSLVNRVVPITELGYWNSTGQEAVVIAQVGRDTVTSNSPLSVEEIFIGAETYGTFNGPVYLDDDSMQHMTIAIAEPGLGNGVLIAGVNLNIVQVIISQLSQHYSHSAYVVDSNGLIVAHPTEEHVTQQTNVFHLPQVQSAIKDAVDFKTSAAKDKVVSIEKSLDGETVLATSFPIGNWGWNVLVEHPRSDVLASLQAPIVRSVLLLIGGLVFAVLTSLILARKMVSPILKLRDAADEMGHGPTDYVADLATGDELDNLGRSFIRMSDQIKESYATLENRVEQRTGELVRSNANLEKAEEESRLANRRLADMNLMLEQRVTERTSELQQANDRLIEAHDQLVRTQKLAAIGELSAGLAHDLRNPLGAIKNAIYYLKGKLLDGELVKENPRIPEFLKIIDEEVGNSNKIITDLMDFARISTPTLLPADLGKLVQDCLSKLEVNEGIYINILEDYPEDPMQVQADGRQLHRVFQNLIQNAQDAMPDGGVITVSTKVNNGFAEVAVSDTGQGIKPENIGKIFDPLFTTKTKGTGLGLAVCQQIVARHGGMIGVKSRSGVGAVFKVRLPLCVQEDPVQEDMAQEVLNATS